MNIDHVKIYPYKTDSHALTSTTISTILENVSENALTK